MADRHQVTESHQTCQVLRISTQYTALCSIGPVAFDIYRRAAYTARYL